MAVESMESRVAAVRRFSRFYTRRIGLLGDAYLDSPFSLTQVRVLYELNHRAQASAAELRQELGFDAGYLSRILRGFANLGLIQRTQSASDARRSIVTLTEAGREVVAGLERRSHDDISALLAGLRTADQDRVVAAMETIESVLGGGDAAHVPYVIRPPAPGDCGWVVQSHGALYAAEYGWDESFEALVAEIVAQFLRGFDAKRERCWIAEVEGVNAGSVFCVRKSARVAQLRLLIVTPEARGLGIGRRLVDEVIRFARTAGYRKLVLWTNDVLVSARRIYEAAGFRLVAEDHHHSFGKDLVGQSWELKL